MKSFIISFFLILIFIVFSSSNRPNSSSYFAYALKQVKKYNPDRKDYVIVIDYRKSIFSKRLYLLDMKKKNIVLSSSVSHAWKSGGLYARKFSNRIGTNTSCMGNFLTGSSRYGKYGYRMAVKGLDRGVNDNALERAIIFHSTRKMKTKWSWGCFATPEKVNKKIINVTKNGVLVCVIV